MKRLATAAILVPLALVAIFRLPGWAFFLLCAALTTGAAAEFARVARRAVPGAPWLTLPLAVPLAAAALAYGLAPGRADGHWTLGFAVALAVGLGGCTLLARTPVEQTLAGAGGLAFGVAYFAAPAAALHRLQQNDPWIVFLLLAIVALGDSAAFYFGTRFGRHRLAPRVSPQKSWEGAVAGFVVSLAAVALWSHLRRGETEPLLLAVGAAVAVASQLGDLVESMFKRGAGVKDSGELLPGHGGLWDRLDSMLFAAPVMLLLLRLVGDEAGR